MPTLAAPDIEHTFGILHATTTLVVFTAPGAIAFVVEPIVFLYADRYPRRWFIAGGLTGMAVAAGLAALAPGVVVLAVAFALWHCASGIACALAQATLVDSDPDRRAATLARWTLFALAGDLLGPLLLAAVAALALASPGLPGRAATRSVAESIDWRVAFGVVAVVLVVFAAAIAARPVPKPPSLDPDEPQPTIWQALRAAFADRVLLVWLFGMTLCDLLDEILVVFASLHVRNELGAGTSWQAAIIGAFMIGGAIGLVALERIAARHPDCERRLLVVAGLACAVSYTAWVVAPAPWLSAVLMLPVGATSTVLYPLVAALAYARFPGRSGTVLAASHLFGPIALALPLGIGVVADHAGTYVALALLVVQPLGLALLARTRAAGVRTSA